VTLRPGTSNWTTPFCPTSAGIKAFQNEWAVDRSPLVRPAKDKPSALTHNCRDSWALLMSTNTIRLPASSRKAVTCTYFVTQLDLNTGRLLRHIKRCRWGRSRYRNEQETAHRLRSVGEVASPYFLRTVAGEEGASSVFRFLEVRAADA
jgi:hypothetical protein